MMEYKKLLLAGIGIAACSVISPVLAQTQRVWVTFRDKGAKTSFKKADYAALGISDHALWRRSKVLPPNDLVDELDVPVNQPYIDELRSLGATVRATSRWFNAVSAELTDSQNEAVHKLSSVAHVRPVAVMTRLAPKQSDPLEKKDGISTTASTNGIDYGLSFAQLNAINAIDVHRQGITGQGVIIGMLDNGFNERTVHPALKNIKVLAEYDFVQRDSNTSRAPGEYATQGNHGEATLSILGGFDNGKMVGVAYGASFILAKTEIEGEEIQLEEDLYVEGLEWLERLGADIVSSSIGYDDWYTYKDFDGNTAPTTTAARIAARKGVLLVTAMGNNGNYRNSYTQTTGTMVAPADADSIVSVGAVDSSGHLASFSSTGPTYDGRVKPEVVALGVHVWCASQMGYYAGSGTSGATPLTAGVAALVLSAHPTLTPMEIRDRLLLSARPVTDGRLGAGTHPNSFYGWGIVDAASAVALPGYASLPQSLTLRANYPNPFNDATVLLVESPDNRLAQIAIYNTIGQLVRLIYQGPLLPGNNYFRWDGSNDSGLRLPSGVYFCRFRNGTQIATQKLLHVK